MMLNTILRKLPSHHGEVYVMRNLDLEDGFSLDVAHMSSYGQFSYDETNLMFVFV